MNLSIKKETGNRIVNKAIEQYKPYAVVVMLSGGNDSLTALNLALELNIKIDFVIHGVTGTGIPETTQFVKETVSKLQLPYLEANAGNAYEEYVIKKGFFGRGRTAHNYAYHLLKASPFQKIISRSIRKRKHNRPVLLLNGARAKESYNRSQNMISPYRRSPSVKNNIWVNLIHHWTKVECEEYIIQEGIQKNPVSVLLNRSGECMCGTMQRSELRSKASSLFPEWGKWIDNLSNVVCPKFGYDWGDNVPRAGKGLQNRHSGQMSLFQPMCSGCKKDQKA